MVSAVADEALAGTEAWGVEELLAVKVLDLLTNRYHAGVVRGGWQTDAESMQVEIQGGSRLQAGQRVRCIVASRSSGVLARGQMRRAAVLHVETAGVPGNLLLELAFMDDPTAS